MPKLVLFIDDEYRMTSELYGRLFIARDEGDEYYRIQVGPGSIMNGGWLKHRFVEIPMRLEDNKWIKLCLS